MSLEQELISKVKGLVKRRHGATDSGALKSTFEAYDANGSGSLEIEELSRVLADAGIGNKVTRGMWVRGILARFGGERDEALSWAAFAEAVHAA